MSKPRPKALITFYDASRRILLQDRRNMSKRGEEWGFFGGGIEPGETPEQAMLREVHEELGYTPTTYRLIAAYTRTFPDGSTAFFNHFIAPLPEQGFIAFHQHEGQGMKLYTIVEARKLKMVGGDDVDLDYLAVALNKL